MCSRVSVVNVFPSSPFSLPDLFLLFSPHRESASCTHVSGLLHALVALCPAQLSPPKDGNAEEDEPLPITSFACQWKQPRKRKESTLPMSEAVFHKPVYGRQQKHIHPFFYY